MLEKRKIPFSLYIILGVAILIVAYYLSGIFTYPDVNFSNLSDYLTDILLHFYQIKRWYNEKTPSCLGIGVIAWLFLCYYIQYHFRNFQDGKEYGAEEWADVEAVNKRRRNPDPSKNRVLTKHLEISTCGKAAMSNNNMLLVASSGKYKTTSIVTPNLLKASDHYIVLDVKADLQFKYGLYFKEKGYAVRSLNLKYPEKSDRYNPFAYIENDEDMVRLIENIYASLEPPDALKQDPFWTDGPKLFMQSLFYYEWFQAKKEGRTGCMNNILSLCNEQTQESDQKPGPGKKQPPSKLEVRMQALAKEAGYNHPAVRDYYKFIGGAAETVKSIVIIVNSKFKLLELPALKRIFEDDDMHLKDFAYGVGGTREKLSDQKVVLFLCSDDTDPSLNFVFSMLYSQAANILCRIADDDFRNQNGSLPIPVGFWMDEIYAGARPANTEVLLGTIRSRNLYMVPILQSISQAKEIFPGEKWQIVTDNCSVFLFWGAAPSAKETHEFISGLLGDMTIDTISDNKNGLNMGVNYGRTGGHLMSPAAVKRMPNEECIVFMEEEFPIYDEKYLPWEDKNKKSAYWQAMALNKRNPDGGYVHPVEVLWDEKGRRYITLQQEPETMRIDGDDPDFLAADLYDYRPPLTIEEMIQMMSDKVTLDDEKSSYNGMKGESSDGEIKEISRDVTGTLLEVWQRFYPELSDIEKQLILRASDMAMPEKDIKEMFNLSIDGMKEKIRMFELSKIRSASS